MAHYPFSPNWLVYNLGDMDVECPFCHALNWMPECLTNSSARHSKFGKCCLSGKITLHDLLHPPHELFELLTSQDQPAKAFCTYIHNYNSALAMTSVGRKVDESLNQRGGGPWSYRLHGELIHKAGSLLPPEGVAPIYSQLYIYDPATALTHCQLNQWNSALDPHTLATLQNMLYTLYPGVQIYKQAFELTRNLPPEQQCRIRLHFDPSTNRRCYQLPDASVKEVAILLLGNGEAHWLSGYHFALQLWPSSTVHL